MSSEIRDATFDLARRLNAGEPVDEAILAAGFDPGGEGIGFEVYPEDPCLDFNESDLIDCGWEERHEGDRVHHYSLTVERCTEVDAANPRELRKVWSVFARERVGP